MVGQDKFRFRTFVGITPSYTTTISACLHIRVSPEINTGQAAGYYVLTYTVTEKTATAETGFLSAVQQCVAQLFMCNSTRQHPLERRSSRRYLYISSPLDCYIVCWSLMQKNCWLCYISCYNSSTLFYFHSACLIHFDALWYWTLSDTNKGCSSYI